MALYEHKIETKPIEIGQVVICFNNQEKIIKEIVWLEDTENHDTYNITVPNNHTYIVNECVVHNADPRMKEI